MVVSQIEESERQVGETSGTATETLTAFMRRYWTFIRSSPQFASLFRLIHAEIHNYPDLARFYAEEVVTRGHRLIASIITRGIETGEFRDVDPMVAARMLTAPFVIHGLWCTHRECSPPSPKRRTSKSSMSSWSSTFMRFGPARRTASTLPRNAMNANYPPRILRVGVALSLIVALLAFFARVVGAQTPPPPQRLSLSEAARLAAAQSASVQGAEMRVQGAQARVTEARSALLPQLAAVPAWTSRTVNSASFGFDFLPRLDNRHCSTPTARSLDQSSSGTCAARHRRRCSITGLRRAFAPPGPASQRRALTSRPLPRRQP